MSILSKLLDCESLTLASSSSIFRSTLVQVPQTEELLKKSRLPFAITLHPFRDVKNLNIIQCANIVRCRYCRTYINPYVYLPDHRHWKCNLCNRNNDRMFMNVFKNRINTISFQFLTISAGIQRRKLLATHETDLRFKMPPSSLLHHLNTW